MGLPEGRGLLQGEGLCSLRLGAAFPEAKSVSWAEKACPRAKNGGSAKFCRSPPYTRTGMADSRVPASPCNFFLLLQGQKWRRSSHSAIPGQRFFQGKFPDFGVGAAVKNASSTRRKTCEKGMQREAALSESLPRALSALCAWIRVLCEVLLGQKDKKRQFALVKSGMAVSNITIGLLQILLVPISL